jgi:sulfur carrier protein
MVFEKHPAPHFWFNGKKMLAAPSLTLSEAMERQGISAEENGIAVAMDGKVIPRIRWQETRISEGARVDVLRAFAGG